MIRVKARKKQKKMILSIIRRRFKNEIDFISIIRILQIT